MELRHLRYFVAVAEEENVSRAASRLHVSQPGVSRQIHDLEDEIGFSLFDRNGKSVRLTAAGKIFFGEARDILARTAEAVKKAGLSRAQQTEINVGYAPSHTVEILPRALGAFRDRFPGVRVTLHDLTGEEMLPLLLQKKLDIALTVAPHKLPRELGMQELERDETCVAVGATHPLATAEFVNLKQMASEPLAALNRQEFPSYHKHLENLFTTIGRKPRISSEHDSVTSLMAAVAAGNEFTLLPIGLSGAAGRRLKLLRLRPALAPWVTVALWRKEAETEAVKAFIAATLAKPGKQNFTTETQRTQREEKQPQMNADGRRLRNGTANGHQ
jgi:LysR family transcriptional regulator, benzoate and cis,cis-muconate-responsive activator of ben and cat genes